MGTPLSAFLGACSKNRSKLRASDPFPLHIQRVGADTWMPADDLVGVTVKIPDNRAVARMGRNDLIGPGFSAFRLLPGGAAITEIPKARDQR